MRFASNRRSRRTYNHLRRSGPTIATFALPLVTAREGRFEMRIAILALMTLGLSARAEVPTAGTGSRGYAIPTGCGIQAKGLRSGHNGLRTPVGSRHSYDEEGMVADVPARAGPA
jgi:hypothetical protein